MAIRTQNKKGIILLSVVIILITIALIGASLIALFSSVNITAQNIADETKALYLAEAGIAYAIKSLRTKAGSEDKMDTTIGPVTLGEGTFLVKIDLPNSVITSIGRVKDSEKKLQLQYGSL